MEIATERLMLRKFLPDDWPAVFAYQQDARYSEYYPWSARTESDAKEFVQWFLDEQAESPRLRIQLAVILRETGLLIGNCGIRRKPDSDWKTDIGYEIAPDYWWLSVLRKLGMREEGRLRENEFFKGRWCDTLVFGLLMEEWAGSTRR